MYINLHKVKKVLISASFGTIKQAGSIASSLNIISFGSSYNKLKFGILRFLCTFLIANTREFFPHPLHPGERIPFW